MNPNYRNLALWAIIAVLLIALFNLFQTAADARRGRPKVAYSDFLQDLDSRPRQAPSPLSATASAAPIPTTATGFQTYSPGDPTLVSRLEEKGVTINARPETDGSGSIFSMLLGWLPMLLLIGVWIFFMRQMQGGGGKAMGFGKSKATPADRTPWPRHL
jgi:cell division protease FtsH